MPQWFPYCERESERERERERYGVRGVLVVSRWRPVGGVEAVGCVSVAFLCVKSWPCQVVFNGSTLLSC